MGQFIFENGFCLASLALEKEFYNAVEEQNWGQLDQLCSHLVAPEGALFKLLLPLARQERVEFIINVRDANNSWEEDGIWHDDGSRVLAFTMGLNLDPSSVAGGRLLIRKKGDESHEAIQPCAFGEVVIFKTGVDNYEHKVLKVTEGQRVVMAGWCYV